MNIIILVWSVFLGSVIGSFLNVCIYRIPRGKSILFPGSFCTACNIKISWYDNIPILSYLVLRGKCRYCKKTISIRYIFVELFCGLITGGLLQNFFLTGNKSLETVIIYILLTYILIIITFIDLKYLVVPNSLTYSGMIFVLVLSVIFPGIYDNTRLIITNSFFSQSSRLYSFLSSLLGMSVSGGIVFITAIAGRYIFRKEAMGMGDVKLMCMSGGIIGWKLGIVVFFIAPFFGLFMAVPMRIIKKAKLIPYAPFLSMSVVLVIFLQEYFTETIDIYIQLIKYLK